MIFLVVHLSLIFYLKLKYRNLIKKSEVKLTFSKNIIEFSTAWGLVYGM